jgi:hypothetical protein
MTTPAAAGIHQVELQALSLFDVDPPFSPELVGPLAGDMAQGGSMLEKSPDQGRAGVSRGGPNQPGRYEEQMYLCGFARDTSLRQANEQKRDRWRPAPQRRSWRHSAPWRRVRPRLQQHHFVNLRKRRTGQAGRQNRENRNISSDQALLGAQRANELVQQILAFSRKTAREKLPVQVTTILKEAVKMLRAPCRPPSRSCMRSTPTGVTHGRPDPYPSGHHEPRHHCQKILSSQQDTGASQSVCLER